MASDLVSLAERCEAATGPDRDLDEAIVTTLCPGATVGEYCGYEDIVFHASPLVPNKGILPFFTASQDAATTLLPERWPLRQANYSAPCADDRKWHLNLHGGREGQDTFVGRGNLPALAFCSAALRARDALRSQDKGEG